MVSPPAVKLGLIMFIESAQALLNLQEICRFIFIVFTSDLAKTGITIPLILDKIFYIAFFNKVLFLNLLIRIDYNASL